jgi:chemotaxis protein methyltransferase CheR
MTDVRDSEGAVDRVAALLGMQIGLRQQSHLRGRLRRCIQDEAAAGNQDIDDYIDGLAAHRGAFQSLVNHITVQESGFFRHPEHFEVLARDILPHLSRPVRIWSAGCGNGQEAFSLAMVLEEAQVEGTVFASDLSTDAVGRTINAGYTARELAGVSPERLRRHFTANGQRWFVNAGLRARVTTAQHNLVDALPDPARSCQVIFCRNVLIYFAPDRTRTFLDRIADGIPTALVFLGAAETMWSSSDRFQAVQVGDCYYYRPRAVAAGVPPSGPIMPRGTASVPVIGHLPTAGELARLDRRTRKATAAPGQPVPSRPAPSPPKPSADRPPDEAAIAAARIGQLAFEAGDHRSAVVAFRQCAYLTPDDALAHLHLGLALEASGDRPSARRAFATARRTMLQSSPPQLEDAIGGYATDELLRLLETKQKELAP